MFKNTADVDDRLQQLRDEFVLSLPKRFANMDVLWATVKQQGVTPSHETDELYRAVHTLAGSAGTFGQQRLGDLARIIEQSLRCLLDNNEIVTPAILSTIENDLLTLKNSVLSKPVVHQSPNTTPTHYSNNSNIHIALLENDDVLTNIIATQLAIYGYRVQCCSNVSELTTVLINQTIAALRIDIELSDGSLISPALADSLLPLQQYNIPLIFISSQDDWDARLAAVRIGAVAYFKKPVDCNVIANRLNNFINTKQ
ncbi:MAG: response regulator [Methylococcales bacterium]|nr:response regulator [Methylococcales bacterium]